MKPIRKLIPKCERCHGPADDLRAINERHGWGKSGGYDIPVRFWCEQCRKQAIWRYATNPCRADLLATHIIALTQPWAWLILNGWKDCENRNWISHLRGRFLIHATLEIKNYCLMADNIESTFGIRCPTIDQIQVGGIVGLAWFGQQADKILSPWFTGRYAFPVTSYYQFPAMFPARGHQRFYKPTADMIIQHSAR